MDGEVQIRKNSIHEDCSTAVNTLHQIFQIRVLKTNDRGYFEPTWNINQTRMKKAIVMPPHQLFMCSLLTVV